MILTEWLNAVQEFRKDVLGPLNNNKTHWKSDIYGKSTKSGWIPFQFSKSCGNLSTQQVLIEHPTSYLFGCFIKGTWMILNDKGETYKKIDFKKIGTYSVLKEVMAEYTKETKGEINLQLFWENLSIMFQNGKITKQYIDQLILLIIEPARSQALVDALSSVFSKENGEYLAVNLEYLKEAAQYYHGGDGPRNSKEAEDFKDLLDKIVKK